MTKKIICFVINCKIFLLESELFYYETKLKIRNNFFKWMELVFPPIRKYLDEKLHEVFNKTSETKQKQPAHWYNPIDWRFIFLYRATTIVNNLYERYLKYRISLYPNGTKAG